MDYVQNLHSVLNDSKLSLGDEERSILIQFSDEKVGFQEKSNTKFEQNEALKNAFHKLIDCGLYFRNLDIILAQGTYSMDNFYERMDKK